MLLVPIVVLFAACSESPTRQTRFEAVRISPSDLWFTDPCVYDPSFSCHSTLDDYLYWTTEGGGTWGDVIMDCPDGCTTYPLGTGTKSKVLTAINNRINRAIPQCENIYNYLIAAYGANQIRHYPDFADPNAPGDTHVSGNDPYRNSIHVSNSVFGDPTLLAKLLIHEAGHGLSYPDLSQASAIAYVSLCLKP